MNDEHNKSGTSPVIREGSSHNINVYKSIYIAQPLYDQTDRRITKSSRHALIVKNFRHDGKEVFSPRRNVDVD